MYWNGPIMSGTIDVPGGVYGDLAAYWYDMPYMSVAGMSKSEIRNWAEMLLPAYMDAVTEGGMPILDMSSPLWLSRNRELRQYMQQRTGYQQSVVDDFLMVLNQAVGEGIIDGRYLSPGTWEEVRPPTLMEKWDPADKVESNFRFLIIAGAITVAVVFIGRAAIKG